MYIYAFVIAVALIAVAATIRAIVKSHKLTEVDKKKITDEVRKYLVRIEYVEAASKDAKYFYEMADKANLSKAEFDKIQREVTEEMYGEILANTGI